MKKFILAIALFLNLSTFASAQHPRGNSVTYSDGVQNYHYTNSLTDYNRVGNYNFKWVNQFPQRTQPNYNFPGNSRRLPNVGYNGYFYSGGYIPPYNPNNYYYNPNWYNPYWNY